MADQPAHALQAAIDDLLNGALAPAERDDVLLRIAREAHTRDMLREAISLRNACRAAYGYQDADRAIAESLPRVLAAAPRSDARGALGGPPAGAPAGRWRRTAAAAALVAVTAAVSAYVTSLAVKAPEDTSSPRGGRLAGIRPSLELPEMTPARRAELRRMWLVAAENAHGLAPWMAVSHDRSEFEYVPRPDAAPGRPHVVLVRCLLASPDGRPAGTVNLLVPVGQTFHLSVPEAAELDGRPVSCDVAMDGQWAAVGVGVGSDRAGDVGVRGRVQIGGKWAEVGEFRLDGKRMRVAIQAIPLNGSVG